MIDHFVLSDGTIDRYDYDGLLNKPQNRASNLVDSASLFPMTTIPLLTDSDDGTYYLGGCAVTDKYIVFAMATSENTKAALYAIDKDDYSEVTANPVVINTTGITSTHCNSMTYNPLTDEIWVKADYYKFIVFDGTTLSQKRVENIPYQGNCVASSFDPITEQWVYVCYTSTLSASTQFNVYIHDVNGELVRSFVLDRVSTAQDCTFYNGLILLEMIEQGQQSSYQSEYNPNFKEAQNILVFDDWGNVLRSWWYSKDFKELEGISILTDGRAIVSTKQKDANNNQIVYALPYKYINDTMSLREYDKNLIIPIPSSSISARVESTEDDIKSLFGIKTGWMQGDVPFLNLDATPSRSNYGVWWLNCSATDITGTKPESSGQGVLIVLRQSSTVARQVWIRVNGVVYNRQYNFTDDTWGAWTSSAST